MKRLAAALILVTALSACGTLGIGERRDRTTPTFGQRIPVLQTETSIEVDPALADIPVQVPGPIVQSLPARNWFPA